MEKRIGLSQTCRMPETAMEENATSRNHFSGCGLKILETNTLALIRHP